MILDSSSFPLFHGGQVFYQLVCPLQLFFLRFSSVSLHCSPIQFFCSLSHAPLAFCMHLLMLLFTSLYFSDPSGSDRFFLSSLLLSHRSRISAVIQFFFFFFCVCVCVCVFVFPSDDVCQGFHWLFQSLLC